jgi:hypothetical protein
MPKQTAATLAGLTPIRAAAAASCETARIALQARLLEEKQKVRADGDAKKSTKSRFAQCGAQYIDRAGQEL